VECASPRVYRRKKKYLELNFEPNVILTTGYIATELCKKSKKKKNEKI